MIIVMTPDPGFNGNAQRLARHSANLGMLELIIGSFEDFKSLLAAISSPEESQGEHKEEETLFEQKVALKSDQRLTFIGHGGAERFGSGTEE